MRTNHRSGREGFGFEQLEHRRMMSADFRSIDGTGNNLANLSWGSVGVDLLRKAAAAYADGASAPAGSTRPSARAISNAIAASGGELVNDRNMSAMVYAWGQFLDHDIDLTPGGTGSFNIAVPQGDVSFDPKGTGTQVIPLTRSLFDSATGTSDARQQVNVITAWIDGSVVYGSDSARAAALRSLVGGKLKVGVDGLLPLNDGTTAFANANDAHLFPDDQLFLAGDVRANENIELTSLQTLFMREHNRQADLIAKQNPKLSDEEIYQRTRQIVIGEIQSITYNEFLPALLGTNALTRYRGYNASVNPGIANEFSTAAFRLGHSMLGDDVEFMDNDGNDVHDEVALSEAFFNPGLVKETGIDPILKYLASDRAQEIDNQVVGSVRNFLFGPPGSGGLDLASLNIQRGRDHGLADYNTARAAYGLPKVTSFAEISPDPTVQQALQDQYGSVDNVDLWVGGLAEAHVQGGSVGPTFAKILADQFQRLRDGDRFWFERVFSDRQLDQIRRTSLADLIARNTGTTNLQANVFFFDVTVRGTVGGLAGRRGPSAAAGLSVQLLDGDGALVDSTTTDSRGGYKFDGLDLGEYQVTVTTADGTTITPAGGQVSVTRGGNYSVANIALGPIGGPVKPGGPLGQGGRPHEQAANFWWGLDFDLRGPVGRLRLM